MRFASVDRTLEKQLGINLFSLGAANSIGYGDDRAVLTADSRLPPPAATPPSQRLLSNLLNLFIFRPDLNLGATLQALEQRGCWRCSPNPTCWPNGKAGELPGRR